MSIESDVYTAITGDSGMSAIISNRLYPLTLPEDVTFPAAEYSVVSDVPHSGQCREYRVQVDLYANGAAQGAAYDTVLALRDALWTLTKSKGNWRWVGGPQYYEDGAMLWHQVVDIFVT